MEWKQRDTTGRKQWELHKQDLTFEQLLGSLTIALKRARRHWVTYRWSDHAIRRLRECIDPERAMTIATDFAATMNMEASLKDNSSIPVHGVLAIYFCYSGHHDAEYTTDDGSLEMKTLINTEVFQFIGDSTSKGKSHDHRYHTQCLLKIIKENEKKCIPKRRRDGSYVPFTYYIESDNCGAQYKCRQNFIFIASVCNDILNKLYPPGRNIRIEHVFAQKFRFKGT